jgi:tRNA threonylcarbamoyladenosine biosynthesis protein TsaB
MSNARILAIDTATEVCSAALLADGVVTARIEAVGQRHSERALPLVDALLRERGLALADLDCIAFGAGPGSFTGLRIACGLAQGLAWGAGKPVIGVGNLQALAARALADPSVQRVLCAIDARMQEAYCAVYERDQGGAPREVLPPQLARAADLAALAAGADTVAGDALSVFAPAWHGVAAARRLPQLRADAADIVRLAATPSLQARAVAAAAAAPLYVRDRVALTTAERRAAA